MLPLHVKHPYSLGQKFMGAIVEMPLSGFL